MCQSWNTFPVQVPSLFCNNVRTLDFTKQTKSVLGRRKGSYISIVFVISSIQIKLFPLHFFALNHHQKCRQHTRLSLLEESHHYQCHTAIPLTFCDSSTKWLAELTLTSTASEKDTLCFLRLQKISWISRCHIKPGRRVLCSKMMSGPAVL